MNTRNTLHTVYVDTEREEAMAEAARDFGARGWIVAVIFAAACCAVSAIFPMGVAP